MSKKTKTREKFIDELILLRQEVIELRTIEARRARAEAERNAAEARFASLLNISADAIIATDEWHQIMLFNRGAQNIFGYRPDEVIGQPIELLIPKRVFVETSHPDSSSKTPIVNSPYYYTDERQGVIGCRKNGEEFPAEAAISTLSRGGETSFIIVLRDITERTRLQERLEAIYRLGQELALLRDEATIARRGLEIASTVIQFNRADLGVVNEDGKVLEYRYRLVDDALQPNTEYFPIATSVAKTETKSAVVPQDLGVVVVQQGQAANVVDTENVGADFPPSIRWQGRAELCVPMKIGERIVGVLRVACLSTNKFTPDDQKLLQTLADQIAVAIENARLYDEIRQQVEELTRLNGQAEMLRQATATLTSTLDPNQVLESILTNLEQVVSYDSACLFLWEERELHAVAARGFPLHEQIIGSRYSTNPPASREVGENSHALMLTSVLQGLSEIDSVPGWLAVPLMVRGRVTGYLTLDSQRPTTYTRGEIALAQAFANQAATAIHNANLYEAERRQFSRLQKSQRQLIQAEKMAALGRLVASVAHEINNPLQATQNALTLIERKLGDHHHQEKVVRHLNVARDEIARISSIVHRLRKFYNNPAANQSTENTFGPEVLEAFYRSTDEELQSVDLHAILKNVLQLTQKQLQHHKIKIEQRLVKDLPEIQGNPDHLKQVFLNLILNAMDAMAQTGGTLQVRTGLVSAQIREQPQQSAVSIELSDTGRGMTSKQLSRLFEPFFTTKEYGSGLGLFVSYKIIEAHHGQINVESHPGLGTTFTILLPLNSPRILLS